MSTAPLPPGRRRRVGAPPADVLNMATD